MSVRMELRLVRKTADYQISPPLDRCGTVFSNRGAVGAVVFTLPQPTAALTGHWYRFIAVEGGSLTVKTILPDTLYALNDNAADSVAISTTNQMVGGVMEALCDNTRWFVYGVSVGVTFTVAT